MSIQPDMLACAPSFEQAFCAFSGQNRRDRIRASFNPASIGVPVTREAREPREESPESPARLHFRPILARIFIFERCDGAQIRKVREGSGLVFGDLVGLALAGPDAAVEEEQRLARQHLVEGRRVLSYRQKLVTA